MSSPFDEARALLHEGLATRAFSCAAIEVGRTEQTEWREALGHLSYEPGAPAATSETVFDLASLTKVIATTSLAMQAVEARRLGLNDPIRRWASEWHGPDRESVTIGDLLAHCSGLTAYLPFYRNYEGRQDYQHAICSLLLEYPPGSQAVYSDLGFILLGFILEDAMGAPLDVQFATIARLVGTTRLRFNPPPQWRAQTAATEVDPWRGRLLVGDVHDENAWTLGGVAGHAGLFGTAEAVGCFARLILETTRGDTRLARRATLDTFRQKTGVPGSSRALGWDTMLPTSSCGTGMSPSAIGHTGFTGTSLWIDPDRDVYVVLLTNRVHPARTDDRLGALRPRVHDAVMRGI